MSQPGSVYVARRRERAREVGLCAVCCVERPADGRKTCATCNGRASKRMSKLRATLRERRKWQHVFTAHEEAGDRARERHLYEDAAEHYQGALDVEFISQSERSRISEKLAYALALGSNPDAARPVFDRVLVSYIDDPSKASKAIEILLQRARQLWIDARTESALPLLAQAIHIAEASNDSRLYKLANGRMSNYLLGLARY